MSAKDQRIQSCANNEVGGIGRGIKKPKAKEGRTQLSVWQL